MSPSRTLRLFGIEADRYTGAGLIQKVLARDLDDRLGDGWRVDHVDGSTGLVRRLTPSGFSGAADASVWVSTPLPVRRPSRRHAHFVFDLRWRTTRSWAARQYRSADLHRIVKSSDHVFAISDHVRDQIVEFAGRPLSVSVVPLGPGQVEGRLRRAPIDTKTIFVTGRARHKRNQELAALLAASPLVRDEYRVITVGVADDVLAALAPMGDRVEHHDSVSPDDLGALIERCSCYIGLTVDEGFGLPYVEAAYCGVDVIAVDGPVARQAIGDHGLFLREPNPSVDELENALQRWDADRIGRLCDDARTRSWSQCVDHVAAWVRDGPS